MDRLATSPLNNKGDDEGSHSGRETSTCKVCGSDIYKVHDGSPDKYAWQHDISAGAGIPHQAYPVDAPDDAQEAEKGIDVEAAFLQVFLAKPKKPVSEMSESEYADHRATVEREKAEGEAWNAKHKINAKHIVDHWDKATDEEKRTGMTWYQDAHHMAKHIAADTGTPMHVMAGLVSNYSPQTHWATNIMTAAKVARTKQPVGGRGEGVLASANQKKAAGRMLHGEHYDKVLAGPKTKAFAHLIEHGGNADERDPKVVVDRHALSVATGHRASDVAYSYSKLGNKGRYEEASRAYHLAAKRISKKVGYKVEAHQVQAATWLCRQRLNEEEDRAQSKTKSSASASLARKAIDHWNSYAGEHHPALLGKIPGTGYSSAPEDIKHEVNLSNEGKGLSKESSMERIAYGETKAPVDVDTLRESECPVCGNDDSWDGDRCQVCGFFRPPQMFMDPDTSVAQQVDLRKDVADQNGLPSPTMDQDGDLTGGASGQANTMGGGMGLDTPVDPSQVTEDGLIGGDPNDPTQPGGGDAMPNTDQPDPDGLQAADAQQAANDMLVPGDIDEAGQEIDPGAANKHFNQGGEAFTPGPNAPTPEQPAEPGALDENGEIPGDDTGQDGQEPAPVSDGEPGTPDDGVPDLVCPACGYQADGGQPLSQGDGPMDPQVASDGMIEGDACPNCGQAVMQSISSVMV